MNDLYGQKAKKYKYLKLKKRRIEKDKKYFFYYDDEYFVDSVKYTYNL